MYFRKITSIYIHIRHHLDEYDEKKIIIEKMHLTQWCGASNFHVKLPRKSLSMQIFQSKELLQKSEKFRKTYYENPRKNPKESEGNLQIRQSANLR